MDEVDEKTVAAIVEWLRRQSEACEQEGMPHGVWWTFKTAADLIESGEWRDA